MAGIRLKIKLFVQIDTLAEAARTEGRWDLADNETASNQSREEEKERLWPKTWSHLLSPGAMSGKSTFPLHCKELCFWEAFLV